MNFDAKTPYFKKFYVRDFLQYQFSMYPQSLNRKDEVVKSIFKKKDEKLSHFGKIDNFDKTPKQFIIIAFLSLHKYLNKEFYVFDRNRLKNE